MLLQGQKAVVVKGFIIDSTVTDNVEFAKGDIIMADSFVMLGTELRAVFKVQGQPITVDYFQLEDCIKFKQLTTKQIIDWCPPSNDPPKDEGDQNDII
jgi:hypothetical protein